MGQPSICAVIAVTNTHDLHHYKNKTRHSETTSSGTDRTEPSGTRFSSVRFPQMMANEFLYIYFLFIFSVLHSITYY
jgi:hypothetical protein